MIKLSSIPCEMQVFSDDDDDNNLLKVRLKLNKTGKNYKNMKFSESSIREAEKTLKNIPILGFLKKINDEGTEYDYDGHNVVTRIVEKDGGYDLEYKFLERPIGVIPETTNVAYQREGEDIYVYCDGYIWKSYANEGLKVILDSDFKGISMEIRIFSGYLDNEGYYNVESFEYRGVTVLGDDVLPAIEGACLVKYDNFSTYKKDIENIIKEIYSMKDGDNVGKVNKVADKVETKVKDEDFQAEPVEDKKTAEPVKSAESVEDKKPAEPVAEGFQAEDKKPADKPDEDCKKCGCDCPDCTCTEGKCAKYGCDNSKPKEEKQDFSMFSELLDEVPTTLEGLFNAIKEKFSVMSNSLKELQDFKDDIDKKALEEKVTKVTNKFSFEDEEITDLKEKVLNKEIGIEQYENQLFCLYGKKMLNQKTDETFSKPVDKKISVDIADDNKVYDDEPVYGDLIKKSKENK